MGQDIQDEVQEMYKIGHYITNVAIVLKDICVLLQLLGCQN